MFRKEHIAKCGECSCRNVSTYKYVRTKCTYNECNCCCMLGLGRNYELSQKETFGGGNTTPSTASATPPTSAANSRAFLSRGPQGLKPAMMERLTPG